MELNFGDIVQAHHKGNFSYSNLLYYICMNDSNDSILVLNNDMLFQEIKINSVANRVKLSIGDEYYVEEFKSKLRYIVVTQEDLFERMKELAILLRHSTTGGYDNELYIKYLTLEDICFAKNIAIKHRQDTLKILSYIREKGYNPNYFKEINNLDSILDAYYITQCFRKLSSNYNYINFCDFLKTFEHVSMSQIKNKFFGRLENIIRYVNSSIVPFQVFYNMDTKSLENLSEYACDERNRVIPHIEYFYNRTLPYIIEHMDLHHLVDSYRYMKLLHTINESMDILFTLTSEEFSDFMDKYASVSSYYDINKEFKELNYLITPDMILLKYERLKNKEKDVEDIPSDAVDIKRVIFN